MNKEEEEADLDQLVGNREDMKVGEKREKGGGGIEINRKRKTHLFLLFLMLFLLIFWL